MKCSVCGNNLFFAHQLVRMDILCDGDGTFVSNINENPAADIYDAENPYGPFTCSICGAEYDELKASSVLTQAERDLALETLLIKLANVPVNPETGQLLEDFGPFHKHDSYEDIWRWFDHRYSTGIAGLLSFIG